MGSNLDFFFPQGLLRNPGRSPYVAVGRGEDRNDETPETMNFKTYAVTCNVFPVHRVTLTPEPEAEFRII